MLKINTQAYCTPRWTKREDIIYTKAELLKIYTKAEYALRPDVHQGRINLLLT